MFRYMLYFTLFAICSSFLHYRWINRMVNFTNKFQISENFIPVIEKRKLIVFPDDPEEPMWEEGEIPWNPSPDNTTVKVITPKNPLSPQDAVNIYNQLFAVVFE